jgi:hypothetical protein
MGSANWAAAACDGIESSSSMDRRATAGTWTERSQGQGQQTHGGSSRDGSDSNDSTGDGGYAGAIARRDVIGHCHRRVRRRAIPRPDLGALRCVQDRAEHRPSHGYHTQQDRLPITTAACRRQQADKTRWVGWRLSCLKPRHDVLAPAACARPLRWLQRTWAASLLSELARQARRPGLDLRYDTNVITRPRLVTRPSPSPSSRSFWRLASGVWLGGRPRRQRLDYCVAATSYWLLGTGCSTRTCLPTLHQCSHVLRTDAANSLRPPQGRRGSLGNALRPSVLRSRSLPNQRSLSPPPPVPPTACLRPGGEWTACPSARDKQPSNRLRSRVAI